MIDKEKIKPCPAICKFDWKQFHKDLDMAMAHMIEEIPGFYPTKASLWDLVEYSFKKQSANGN